MWKSHCADHNMMWIGRKALIFHAARPISFKNFFKKDNNKTNIYFKELFEKTFKLIQSRLKDRDVQIIQNNYTHIRFDTYESELIQVFINIINNSIDAFENISEDKYIFIDVKEFDNKIVININDIVG